MTPTTSRFRLRSSSVVGAISLIFVGALALYVVLPGCTRPPTIATKTSERGAVNPWPGVIAQLRKENDTASCRRILIQLNNDLAQKPDVPQPVGLIPEQEKAIGGLLNLSDTDLKEVRPSSFSGLDAAYLSDCLYLRDAALSMDVAGLPPARQAELTFAWVCRQVVLQPWITANQQGQPEVMPPVPPTAVLRRGSGSGLERAYVMLALLQQLNLDGALVGPPDAASGLWSANPDARGLPRGPFWAVAVRAGADVLLFNPWRGEAVPGPNGQGVSTLVQIKANADQLKPWFEDKSSPWKVSPDEVKNSVPFLMVPLSAVAPRMNRLQEELKSDSPVRLAVDPTALQERFSKETKLADLKFWNPPAEFFSYTRSIGSFTPKAEGGSAPVEDLALKYKASLLPPSLFATPGELAPREEADVGVPEAVQKIREMAVTAFGVSFLTPPTPREQIQRGHFFEVTPLLVGKRREFDMARDRIRLDHDLRISDWAQTARDLYNSLARAREQKRTNPEAVTRAQEEVDLFWQAGARTFAVLVDRAVADAGLAEATYLLAQCKHEQAMQLQSRAERLAADPKQKAAAERARIQVVDAWGEAKGWWDKYVPYAPTQDRAFPGRAAQAKRLTDQAASRLADARKAQ